MRTHSSASQRSARQVRGLAGSGFTLLETALTTVIIGVGVLAVMEAQQAFLERNTWSTQASTATYLANEIREMSEGFPRHDRFAGGIYFATAGDPATFAGWGPENGEVVVVDLDDLDDLDGAVFGDATDFPTGFTLTQRYAGPINAFGDVIPETLYDGTTETFDPGDGTGEQIVPMRNWTQIVQVEKVDPYDLSTVVPNETEDSIAGIVSRAVDRYPVRVTVSVLFQDDPAGDASESTSISWVVLPE